MSQIIRPTTASPARDGMIRKVAGSGIATMSDSSIALKPVIEEPSKPIPSSRADPISCGVIAKLFRCPSRSVNQKRTYSTFCASISFSTCLRDPGSDVARCLLSIIAMSCVPPSAWKCERAPGARPSPVARPRPRRLKDSRSLSHRPYCDRPLPGSAGTLQLAVFLRVDLAAAEDPEADRDGDDADQEQRPDLVPHRSEPRTVEDRVPDPVDLL